MTQLYDRTARLTMVAAGVAAVLLGVILDDVARAAVIGAVVAPIVVAAAGIARKRAARATHRVAPIQSDTVLLHYLVEALQEAEDIPPLLTEVDLPGAGHARIGASELDPTRISVSVGRP